VATHRGDVRDLGAAAWVRRHAALLFVALLTALSGVVIARFVRLDPDIVALLPSDGDGAALGRYIRGFGGGGLSVVLAEGDDPEETRAVSDEIAAKLAERGSVAFTAAKIDLPTQSDPLLLWRTADASTREKLAGALTPEGMRERLAGTRQILLAPGSGAAVPALTRDPLRLSSLAYESRRIGAGVRPRSDGYFATDDGKAHVILVKARGQALRGADAKAFIDDVDATLAPIRAAHPSVTLGVTGPHAVAAEMETMLRRDLTWSGTVSMLLASLAFAVVFRRVRALLAVAPPLALGTLWTAALAAFWPGGISAIAVAFTSVVVGVGFDTGVHVYAALLEGRRRGLSPHDAAAAARRETAKPVLTAAVIAGVAFASLSLSSVAALRQLGLLCAAGEVLTAIAIVLVTPSLGALLERGAPPPVAGGGIARFVHAVTKTPRRAAIALTLCGLAALLPLVAGVHVGSSIVAVRPKGLPALEVESRIFERFGGRPQPFIVLVADADRDAAMHRADQIAEKLALDPEHVERVDALTSVLPSEATQRERLAERDRLNLPARADDLERALADQGFAVSKFDGLTSELRAAPPASPQTIDVEHALGGDLGVVGARYLAREPSGVTLVALHVHLTDAQTSRDALEADVHAVDPGAKVTGYAKLEVDLRAALLHDLPRIGALAGLMVLVLLAISLRRFRDVALAALVLSVGISALIGVAGLLKVPLHIYSALVVPVLLGVSVDEAMFLLHHARAHENDPGDPIGRALDQEAMPVVATALTTAAGFAALAFAHYDGLADLGKVGAIGNAMNLVVALVLVPAGLRLLARRRGAGANGAGVGAAAGALRVLSSSRRGWRRGPSRRP